MLFLWLPNSSGHHSFTPQWSNIDFGGRGGALNYNFLKKCERPNIFWPRLSESSTKTAFSSANISDTTGLTDAFFGVTIEKMQPYILPVNEASRFTDFEFINCDVQKIWILSQYLANDWRYRHLIQANYSPDAALYLTQRWSFTLHWLQFYQPWRAKNINSQPISFKPLEIQTRNLDLF